MSDDDDQFFGRDEAAEAEKPGGLITPHRARVIKNAAGEIIYDENSVEEQAYRAAGKPRVLFCAENPNGPEFPNIWEPDKAGDEEARYWAQQMSLPEGLTPTVAEAERWRTAQWRARRSGR